MLPSYSSCHEKKTCYRYFLRLSKNKPQKHKTRIYSSSKSYAVGLQVNNLSMLKKTHQDKMVQNSLHYQTSVDIFSRSGCGLFWSPHVPSITPDPLLMPSPPFHQPDKAQSDDSFFSLWLTTNALPSNLTPTPPPPPETELVLVYYVHPVCFTKCKFQLFDLGTLILTIDCLCPLKSDTFRGEYHQTLLFLYQC